jgi:hypothetical protein
LIAGGETRSVDLRVRFGMMGAYTYTFIPTMVGEYTFRFHGTIGDRPVDERFVSGPGRFNNVESTAALEFPRRVPTTTESFSAAQVAQVATAVYQMDSAGLHDLDEALAAGRIPRGALGSVQRVRVVVQATTWPAAMRPMVAQFVEHATRLEAALRAEDVARAAPEAHEVHELGHDISRAAYAWLAQHGGGDAPAHGHGASGGHSAGGSHGGAASAGHSHEAFVQPAGVPAPTLRLEAVADPLGGVNLHLITTNWTWAPEKVNLDAVANEGHAHLYVNDSLRTRLYGPWHHLKLDPGTHRIRVTLNVNSHADIMADGQIVEAVATVTVPSPAARQ